MLSIFGFIPPLGWGINNILIAKVSRKFGALQSGLGVQLIGLLLTLPLFLVFPSFRLPTHTWLQFIIAGLASGFIFWTLCQALVRGQASIVAPISATWVIISSVLGFIFFKESASANKLLALPVACIGIILLSANWKSIAKVRPGSLAPGAGLALLLAFGFGFNSFFSAVVIREIGWLSATVAIRAMAVSILIILLAFKTQAARAVSTTARSLPVWLAAASDVVAYTSFNIAISSNDLSWVSFISGLTPLVSVVAAIIFLNERLTRSQAVGVLFAILGVLLFQI